MKRSFSYFAFAILVIASVLLSSCTPAATPEPTAVPAPPTQAPPEPTAVPPTAVPEPEIGSPEHPIKVLFVPSVDANTIVSGGKIMSDALNKATGLTFEVSVPTSYSATIEEMCASPKDTIGFIPALGYVLANQLCGVDVSFAAVRFGSAVYWAQILVARDSDFKTLKDLDGKKFGMTDPGSTSGYLVPLAMFQEAGIKPSESIETGGHPQSVKAVYNGEVDFSASFYTPFGVPEGKEDWKEGDAPDVPDEVIKDCKVTADGKTLDCHGYVIRDARANIREEAPDVIEKVRVLTISEGIPNDTLSFGPEFDPDIRAKIEEALTAFAKTEDFKTSIGSPDFYNWTGIAPAKDADYDFVRLMVDAAGITLESLGQ